MFTQAEDDGEYVRLQRHHIVKPNSVWIADQLRQCSAMLEKPGITPMHRELLLEIRQILIKDHKLALALETEGSCDCCEPETDTLGTDVVHPGA